MNPDTEERFLAGIAAQAIPVDALMDTLRAVYAAGEQEQADSLAELLQDALADRDAVRDGARLLDMRAAWHAGDPGFGAAALQAAVRMLGKGKAGERLAGALGFGTGLALDEAFARLRTFIRLDPGILCRDKTWGFGVLRRVDAFYLQVEIDFAKKPGHLMSLAYAVEALELLGDDHILVRKHKNPEAIKALAQSDPAELVRIAIRSYGPMNATRLQEVLAEGFVAEAEWKTFWDAARKKLKADPLVDMPGDRKSPIRLRDKPKSYDGAWFAALGRERDMERVLALVAEAETNAPEALAEPAHRAVAGERIAFVVRGAGERQPGLMMRGLMAARRLNVDAAVVSIGPLTESFLSPDALLRTAKELSASDTEAFVRHLVAHDRERLLKVLVELLPNMELTLLNAAMDLLIQEGRDAECADRLRGIVAGRKETVELLWWLCRRLDLVSAWSVCAVADLPFLVIQALQAEYSGEHLRAANQLAVLFQQSAWLEQTVTPMNEVLRRDLILKLSDQKLLLPIDSRSVMAKLIRMFPALSRIFEATAEDSGAQAQVQAGFTSWRSYAARQAQLERLVNEEIPKNSKEIGVARSYGDLSENYEYKAAKEHQRLLMRRKMELERDLETVRGTDFAEYPKDVAGMGTAVAIRYADGRVERYHILGEWDQELAMGIIACGSRMAQSLAGHRPGEEVSVPSDSGDVRCTVTEVSDISDAVKQWVKGSG